MAISPENRHRLLAATKAAAASFVEDMDYVRKLLDQNARVPSDIRRLSAILRRLLIDNDLRSIAPPRVGEFKILAPDNSPIYEMAKKQRLLLFVSGGPKSFGLDFRALGAGKGFNFAPGADFDPARTVQLSLDGFLTQRVLAFEEQWFTRRQVIQYVANIISGVHSGNAMLPHERAFARIQAWFKLSPVGGGAKIRVDPLALPRFNLGAPEFKWTVDEVDFVLLELFAAAYFLAESSDIKNLESTIRAELR